MLQSLMFMWLYRFKNFVAIMKVLTEQWQWTLKELLAFEFSDFDKCRRIDCLVHYLKWSNNFELRTDFKMLT